MQLQPQDHKVEFIGKLNLGPITVGNFSLNQEKNKFIIKDITFLNLHENNIILGEKSFHINSLCQILFRSFLDISYSFRLDGRIEVLAKGLIIPQCFYNGFWVKDDFLLTNLYEALITDFNKRFTKTSFSFLDFKDISEKEKTILANLLGVDISQITYKLFYDNWPWEPSQQLTTDIKISSYIKEHLSDASFEDLGEIRFKLFDRELRIYQKLRENPNSFPTSEADQKLLSARFFINYPQTRPCLLKTKTNDIAALCERKKASAEPTYVITDSSHREEFGKISFTLLENIVQITSLQIKGKAFDNIEEILLSLAIECSYTNLFCNQEVQITIPPHHRFSAVLFHLGFKKKKFFDHENSIFVLKQEALKQAYISLQLTKIQTFLNLLISEKLPSGWNDLASIENTITREISILCSQIGNYNLDILIRNIYYSHPKIAKIFSLRAHIASTLKTMPPHEHHEVSLAPAVLQTEYPKIFYCAIYSALNYPHILALTLTEEEEEEIVLDEHQLSKKFAQLEIPLSFYKNYLDFYEGIKEHLFSNLKQHLIDPIGIRPLKN